MKKTIMILIIILGISYLFALNTNLDFWQKKDFIGFDEIGDNKYAHGDIASLFFKETEKMPLIRITFADMIERRNNSIIKDNFDEEDLILELAINSEQNEMIKKIRCPLDFKVKESRSFILAREPAKNLLVIGLKNFAIDKFIIDVKIYKAEKLVDSFSRSNKNNAKGGNCAFVHHGNQGLTYTEVFYGQHPQESSGFDEILEVHEATNIPGNFHMSGTLMPAAEWHNPEFNDWLVNGVESGYVSMLSSALGQHIMPFVQNEMNNWSVNIETDMVAYRYGYQAKVAWVPERVWLAPGIYPDAGVIDWLGDNWTQHGVEAVILDDTPHCSGHSNSKIHWMNNGSGINLRVIPINNDFVGAMHYDADNAKNMISNTGQYDIIVYGTDWEVAAEMNEHHETMFLDNYENVLWYCYDNYPAVNVWKLDNAIANADFNGNGIEVIPGTYWLLGGDDGYGGSNNSWYINWAGTASHSDYHDEPWTYGYIWNNAYENLISSPDNDFSQLGWYTLMINLHETGWHDGGEISGWEHRYSSHMKNANVYAEVSRWLNGDYENTTDAFFSDIDRDGVDEVVMHNDKAYFVFESIGGRAVWVYAKDDFGNAYSLVGSDVAYYPETDGDYNESSNNHVAALSDVSPNYQHDFYDVEIVQSEEDLVKVKFSKDNLEKECRLETGNAYLSVDYDYDGSVFIKSGWTPDLLDIIWNGKANIQRMWGENASYCGRRNKNHGGTVSYVLGNGGALHNGTFEGTIVMGDEIYGENSFTFFLYAGYTDEPYDEYENHVTELDELAVILEDSIAPQVVDNIAFWVGDNKLQIVFNEEVTQTTATDLANYELQNFQGDYTIEDIILTHSRRLIMIFEQDFVLGDFGNIILNNIEDMNGNQIAEDTSIQMFEIIQPHIVGSMNDWTPDNHDYDLVLDDKGLWKATFTLPAGSYDYKIIETNDWNDNDWPADNQSFELDEAAEVEFFANCGVKIIEKNGDEFVFHSLNMPAVVGDFLSEIGGTDWNETTELTYMNDEGIDGDEQADDGIFSYQTNIPSGNYQYKIVLNNNWEQNTTAGNLDLNLTHNSDVTFHYNMIENIVTVEYTSNAEDEQISASSNFNCKIYPNPFNPTTKISYQNIDGEDNLTIEIFNLKGQIVKSFNLNNQNKDGYIVWNGRDAQNREVASGVYLFKVCNGKEYIFKKGVLLK